MKIYAGAEPVTFKGAAGHVMRKDPAVVSLATIRTKGTDLGPEMPGVVTHTYGKGRVVYFAAGLDSGYYLYSYPYQRLALRHAIEWAASAPPPVRVEAPMCVHANLMHQKQNGAERLILHLFSDLNTTAQHALPVDDVPLREETVPIHDIRVTWDPRYRIRSVHQEPEGRKLKFRTSKEGTTVTVPQLDVHSMVVAELESPG